MLRENGCDSIWSRGAIFRVAHITLVNLTQSRKAVQGVRHTFFEEIDKEDSLLKTLDGQYLILGAIIFFPKVMSTKHFLLRA
jgi:hypothetical protein